VAAARLQLVYINSVRGTNRLWSELSVGQNVCGAKSPDTFSFTCAKAADAAKLLNVG